MGLKVVAQYDRTRPYPGPAKDASKLPAGENARPLQTLIWYPAVRGAAKPMTIGDYVALADTEIQFNTPDEKTNKWRSRLKHLPTIPMWAARDANAAQGRYPVVIYAPSGSSVAWENSDLCEYLASSGYVVLASRSMGVSTCDMTEDLEGINSQARDISFLITYAGTLPNADLSRVAVVSFSWGGISSLFAAARDPRIAALAQLDGSTRYFPGLVKKAGDVHAEQLKIPLLFFAANNDDYLEDHGDSANLPPNLAGPSALNAWRRGDFYKLTMLGMSHPEFCSMFQRWKTAEMYALDAVADYGRDDTNTNYAWTALYTLKFLDEYLKADDSAKGFLARSPADNGVPKHFMAIFRRSGENPPLEEAISAAAERGYEQTVATYRAFVNDPMHRNVGDLEKRINVLGYALMSAHKNEAAVRVFRLNSESHSESANVFDSLGDGYSAVGDKANAIKAYQHSVELNPANEHAKGEIDRLQSQ